MLERISHCKMECEVTTEFGMYNRKMFFSVVVHRVDSFHTTVKTQNEESLNFALGSSDFFWMRRMNIVVFSLVEDRLPSIIRYTFLK